MYGPVAFLEKRLPWQGNKWKRFFAELFLSTLMAVLAIQFWCLVNQLIKMTPHGSFPDSYVNLLWQNTAIATIMNLFLVSIYEGIVLFAMWKQSIILNEKLEKENVISKFEALKNQVNPHFLFNSLNTLSNLVHEDQSKAEDFIVEFSEIYRYVLEKKDQPVVSLAEELDFVNAYLKLCHIRFGEGLKSNIKVNIDHMESLIPTLSLQTLVENAIKHNRITRKEPLTIDIYDDMENLIVENNFQPRSNNNRNTGMGLSNITERYSILCDKKPEFFMNNSSYLAKLPLLQPE
jgi:LytS/YehU family sensor histidine kinase